MGRMIIKHSTTESHFLLFLVPMKEAALVAAYQASRKKAEEERAALRTRVDTDELDISAEEVNAMVQEASNAARQEARLRFEIEQQAADEVCANP